MKPFIPVISAILSLAVGPPALSAQELTPEEQWQTLLALHQAEELPTYKAPLDAMLPPYVDAIVVDVPIYDFTPRALRTALPPRVVDADASNPAPIEGDLASTPRQSMSTTPVTLASFKPPQRLSFSQRGVQGAVQGNPPTLCFGVCASFSSQGDAAINALTGKKLTNFQVIEALVCSPNHAATVPAGMILQLANSIGIQTVQSRVGAAIVAQTVSLNWRSIAINTVKYGTAIALGVMAPGAVAVSKSILTAVVAAHVAADTLPALFSPGAPNPDPLLSNMLDGAGSLSISPGNCQDVLFSGVFDGPGTSFVTSPIQLMP